MDQLDAFAEDLDEDVVAAARVAVFATHYSERNATLIVMQCPAAREVHGYTAWKSEGRQVRKGEHGIRILAPAGHSEAERDESGQEIKKGRQFYKLISVFDISQTDPIVPADPGAE
jgi:antirestriction protein ArdC